jgi:hypothetical protein
VWNPDGERVEGYTNFGWMLVMAVVHRAGAADARAALWVRAVNWTLGCAVLLLAVRLLSALGVNSALGTLTAVGTLALSEDLLFWSINGFETTLLTALFLWGLLRAMDDGTHGEFRVGTCLIAGLLPVVRADAIDFTVAIVAMAWVLGARRRWWLLALAALPLLAHEAFRVSYYGDWFPNTYYLKVAGRGSLFLRGLAHLKDFAGTYAVALVCGAAGCVVTNDRRLRWIMAMLGLGFARVLFVGPDMFPGFRFLAPYVPVLVVAAVAAIGTLAKREPAARWAMAAMLVLGTVFNAGVSGRESFAELLSTQADPYANTVAGVLLTKYADPDSRVVVAAAGCLPYFSRLHAVDSLGKMDRHIARLPPATRDRTGVNRFDVDWSLRTRPDFVVAPVRHALASQPKALLETLLPDPARDFVSALLLNDIFINEYRDQPVPVPFLLGRNPLFVHRDSSERAHLDQWRAPDLGRR